MAVGTMLNMLVWIIIIGFAIYGFVLLIMNQFEGKQKQDKAILILKERFARGEIDEKEFEDKKILLSNK